MATYQDAVSWIAANDAAGDTPEGMEYTEAYSIVHGMISLCLVVDLWEKEQGVVAVDVLRKRGFKKPRGLPLLATTSPSRQACSNRSAEEK